MIDTSNIPQNASLQTRSVARFRSVDRSKASVIVEYTYTLTAEDGSTVNNFLGYDINYYVNDQIVETKSSTVKDDALKIAGDYISG